MHLRIILNDKKDDHKRAKEIEGVLKEFSWVTKVEPAETNIIVFELKSGMNELEFVNILAQNNIKIIGMGGGKLRIVTHLDYTDKMHDIFLSTLNSLPIKL